MAKSVEEWIGARLLKKCWCIATAESCTGGLIASRITDVSGSSAYFERGFITYSNEAKMALLGVSRDILAPEGGPGAVSEACARAMAEGVRVAAGSEVGLSVTGIAGPTGGSPEKPVGTVCMAVALPYGTVCRRRLFKGSRLEVKAQTAQSALELAREVLMEPERDEAPNEGDASTL